MDWQLFARIESAAIAVAGLLGYFVVLDGSPLLFLVLILAPDISMVGYLHDSRTGALIYNAVHTYLGPVVLVGYGVLAGIPAAQQVGLVWMVHIAADRVVGFGLKTEEGFGHTHLRTF